MSEEESNNTESGGTGETEIKCTLGMMQLQMSTHAGPVKAREEFETLWENRVSEIEESQADTLKESIEPDENSVRLG
jgi:hypothetical protein